MTTTYFLYPLISYFSGSIPSGLILSNLFGNGKLRELGSKNIGATNVLRTQGKLLGALTLLFDFSKAFYVQTKKDELKETLEQISRRKEDLSDVKEQITEARETLTDVRIDLARSRSEAERIIEEANELRKKIHLEEV